MLSSTRCTILYSIDVDKASVLEDTDEGVLEFTNNMAKKVGRSIQDGILEIDVDFTIQRRT